MQSEGKYCLPSKHIDGTYTIFFVSRHTILKDKKITYANFVCNIKLSKIETHRVCLTVGGNKLAYDGDPSSPEISLLNLNIYLNSVISDA